MSKDNDIFLYYSGGSGGFLLLHGILLSRVHHADNYEHETLSSVVKNQWDLVKDHGVLDWRKFETWPNNEKTKELNCMNKIYFKCNPGPNELKINTDTYASTSKKLCLYTDIDTQYQLMNAKNANIAEDIKTSSPSMWEIFYNRICDDWDFCKVPNDIKKLPFNIQNKIYDTYPNEIEFYGKSSASVKEMLVSIVNYYKKYSDYEISLGDVIKTRFKNVTDLLNIPYTVEHEELVDTWMSLHPQNIQEKLLKL